ncbi:MAG: starch-binding protein [Clostridia bacterium]|nr:starch-binding protein [Clostridia bacterium]
MKKFLSFLLTFAMLFSLAMPAMAAEDTRTIYFENTNNWSTVNAYAWDAESIALLGTWPGTAMTKVEGEENIYSIEVPTDAVNMIFNNGSEQTADLTIPTDGKNLYTYNSGWSTYGSTGDEPTINGNTEGDVTASFAPEIYLSGISNTGDTVRYDSETNTYITVFPVGAESITYKTVYSGKNLAYYRDAADKVKFRETSFCDGSVAEKYEYYLYEYNFFSYDDTTGNLTIEATPANSIVSWTTVFEYSNDGGSTWQEACTQVFVQAYSITNSTAADANGSVTVPASAIEGETVNLTVTPAEGYELDELKVTYEDADGVTQNVIVTDNAFTMPAFAVTVTATFQQATETYTVTVDENIANGTVVVNPTTYTAGQTVTLAVTPADGYVLDQLTVTNLATDEPVNVYEDYTFTMPEGDVTVTATFKKVYTIIAIPWGAGTVDVPASAAAGDTVTVTFTPDPGYVLFEQEAFDPDNSSDYVELMPGENAYTFTFQMPAHNVQVNGDFAKEGKAREDLYFNNGGNTDWTDVNAYFCTDTGSFIDSATLIMAENGVYTLPEDAEIPNLAYMVYFANSTGTTTATADIPTDENNMFTLGTTTNEYEQYEGTWSVYTPSQPPVGTTSAEISWGSLAYTYSDETGEWTTDGSEGAGTVTVKNTGDNAFNAQPLYTAKEGYTEITGHFYESMDATVTTMYADLYSGDSFTFYLKLKNKPSKALNGDTIATVTIRITEGIGE